MEQLHLVLLITTFDQNEKLFGRRLDCLFQRPCDHSVIARSGVPQGLDGFRSAWCKFAQARVGFGVGLRQGGQRVDTQEQRACLGIAYIEDFDVDLHIGVEIAAKLAVDQLEPAVWQLVGQEAAGKADLLIESHESAPLLLGVEPKIEFVGDQVPCTDTAMGFDAVADGIHGKYR